MDAALDRLVWERARERCEYCGCAQSWYLTPFQIDHIIARKHAGPTVESNLALSCFHCNLHKGSDIASLDSGVLTRLFNPRIDDWREHFTLESSGKITSLSPIGSVTVFLLKLNDAEPLRLRQVMLELGVLLAGEERGWRGSE
jgi:HNH endonuclease